MQPSANPVPSVPKPSPLDPDAARLAVQALLTEDTGQRRSLLAAAMSRDSKLRATLVELMRDCGWDDQTVREDLQFVAGVPATGNERNCWTEVLPELVRRLARLEQLERHFAAAVESEKMTAIYSLAYGASHEINNPLANISSRAQTLLRDETDVEKRRKLETINNQAFRAHAMIADLMLFAKPPSLQLQIIDVAVLLRQAEQELRPVAEAQQTELLINSAPGQFPIRGDREHLVLALQSLCRNSLEALGSGGRISVRLSCVSAAGEELVNLSVEDDGPGIPAEILPRVFDPFFSGREAGRGLGLGLSKCWRIVTLHSGTISVHSQAGQGAQFTIQLPLVRIGDRG